jgi:hypothetical protein
MRQIDRAQTAMNVEDEASLQKSANVFGGGGRVSATDQS